MPTAPRPVARVDDLDITDNEPELRYEATLDGQRAGVLEYWDDEGVLVLEHTEVPEAFEGRGIGGRLVKAALDDLRARGLRIESRCPFVTAYLKRHPEYADLVRSRAT